MVIFDRKFVAGDHSPGPERSAIVDGRYRLRLQSVDKRVSKSGDHTLLLSWVVDEGPSAGYEVSQFLNLWHKAERVRGMAARDLAAVCLAMGLEEVTNTSVMLGRRAAVDVKFNNGYARFRRWAAVDG